MPLTRITGVLTLSMVVTVPTAMMMTSVVVPVGMLVVCRSQRKPNWWQFQILDRRFSASGRPGFRLRPSSVVAEMNACRRDLCGSLTTTWFGRTLKIKRRIPIPAAFGFTQSAKISFHMALEIRNQNDAGKPKRLEFVSATLKALDFVVTELANLAATSKLTTASHATSKPLHTKTTSRSHTTTLCMLSRWTSVRPI